MLTIDALEADIASLIDHSLLATTATPEQVNHWCDEAERFGFASVCVQPIYVRQVADRLHDARPNVCTVIGFPAGVTTSAVKLYEAQEATENGAVELDVVINLSWLKSGRTEEVHRELAEICESTGQVVKAILETALLTDAEKRLAAEISMDAGVSFLKTSTGWHGGATVSDIKLLKECSRGRVGLKASGGIRTLEQVVNLLEAGATRLGTSRGVDLIQQRDDLGGRD